MGKKFGKPFGVTKNGEEVRELDLDNGTLAVKLITFGGIIRTLTVPGRDGPVDVVLGYDTLAEYENGEGYFGALIGRYANRIARGRFALDGKEYALAQNDGSNHLHGGNVGYSHRVWTVEEADDAKAVLTLDSPDGEEGYPGRLQVKVTYTLEGNALSIHYEAISDRDTPCNLTNHSYFNLNGGGSAMGHRLWLGASRYTPVGTDSIPISMSRPVAGSPFDFTAEKLLGRDIDADDQQLKNVGGYDHHFVLDGAQGLRRAARLVGDKTGIVLEVWTEKPGIQLYTANMLRTDSSGKGGETYRPRQAVCLETQFFPNSPNHPEWGDILLRPDRKYDYITEFRFSRG